MSNNSPRPLNLICRDAEAELLLHCARVQVDPKRAERIGELVRQELDWDSLLSVAQRNGLLPLLSFHLNRICAPDVPRERLQYLRTYFQSNSALNLLLTAELVKLLDQFSRQQQIDRKSTRLNSSHGYISYAVFCLKKKK